MSFQVFFDLARAYPGRINGNERVFLHYLIDTYFQIPGIPRGFTQFLTRSQARLVRSQWEILNSIQFLSPLKPDASVQGTPVQGTSIPGRGRTERTQLTTPVARCCALLNNKRVCTRQVVYSKCPQHMTQQQLDTLGKCLDHRANYKLRFGGHCQHLGCSDPGLYHRCRRHIDRDRDQKS